MPRCGTKSSQRNRHRVLAWPSANLLACNRRGQINGTCTYRLLDPLGKQQLPRARLNCSVHRSYPAITPLILAHQSWRWHGLDALRRHWSCTCSVGMRSAQWPSTSHLDLREERGKERHGHMERGSSDWLQLFKWELAFLVALKFLVNERFPMIWWRFQKIYATRAFMCHRLEPSPKIIPWKAVNFQGKQ